jgi:hypothetical protein
VRSTRTGIPPTDESRARLKPMSRSGWPAAFSMMNKDRGTWTAKMNVSGLMSVSSASQVPWLNCHASQSQLPAGVDELFPV